MQTIGHSQHPIDGSLESTIRLVGELIAYPSVSSVSNLEATDWCERALTGLGFQIWRTRYQDARGIEKCNLVARRSPLKTATSAGLAYFCHTDVVPADHWEGPGNEQTPTNPFRAVVTEDRVYGRGACDMKGSAATMLSAIARVPQADQTAPIWFVCTADEEIGFLGAKHLSENCDGYRTLAESDPLAIIGEPTELDVVHAHKGIQGFTLRSRGRAAHSATGLGINANEAMVPVLEALLQICQRTRRDPDLQDQRFDPPTLSWNFGVSDHCDVANITPEQSDAWVSLRTMPGVDGEELIAEVRGRSDELGLSFQRSAGCDPLWNDAQSDHVKQMLAIAGTRSKTVCYATDGGVLGELSRRIVIGPGSIDQAHTTDEFILIEQLSRGIDCYEKAIRHWCLDRSPSE